MCVFMQVWIYRDMCTDVHSMYMYICEHAYFWDEQKGEERKTPGCRLAVGRPRALKPFPTARPSPAPLQPSLHPPSPRFGQCTNITDTLMLRSATLGSTLRRWPNLQPVDGFARAETLPIIFPFPSGRPPSTNFSTPVVLSSPHATRIICRCSCVRPAQLAVSPCCAPGRGVPPRSPRTINITPSVMPFLYCPHNGCAHAIETLLEYPTI